MALALVAAAIYAVVRQQWLLVAALVAGGIGFLAGLVCGLRLGLTAEEPPAALEPRPRPAVPAPDTDTVEHH